MTTTHDVTPLLVETSRSKGFSVRPNISLPAIATLLSIILALQSYGVLPYQMSDIRERVIALEKSRQIDRDLLISLQAQLVAARDEMRQTRVDISALRGELRSEFGRRSPPP